jgi:hypothetical protein
MSVGRPERRYISRLTLNGRRRKVVLGAAANGRREGKYLWSVCWIMVGILFSNSASSVPTLDGLSIDERRFFDGIDLAVRDEICGLHPSPRAARLTYRQTFRGIAP